MLTLGQLLPDAQRILGTCDTDYVNRRINEAVELLANKGDFDPYIAVLDIVATSTEVPMPPEVETVLSVNTLGVPTKGYDRFFNFHLDGPGDLPVKGCVRWRWKDGGESPVFSNPSPVARLYAVCENAADSTKFLTVYGYDENGAPLGHVEAGVFIPGISIPMATTALNPSSGLPRVSVITRVSKPATAGGVKLYSGDTTADGILRAYYRPEWEEPLFRLITVDRPASNLRILFRRKVAPLARATDLIPLHSPSAVLAMLRSLKYYDEGQLEAAQAYEATAMRWLEEEQRSRTANLHMPPQIDIATSLMPTHDQMY